ncbi:MAG: prepilin-type N-terminal cleavage/methylation domain-containing protein [Armatimonadetes bacterium]|nr:prepilin-type N-terminal cleavage/methylation domain-containing protein [Armatimonadota bacterium]
MDEALRLRFRRSAAFSLIEIMITLAVVSMALLGLLGALTFGLRASDHAESMTQATNTAREIIGVIRDSEIAWDDPLDPALDDAENVRRGLTDGPAPLDTLQLPAPTSTMRRNIQVVRGIGPDPEMADIARIRVRVFWTVRGHEKSVELTAFQRNPN